ncbi:IclR family transcriptional regulator [Bordetella genomosp. 11]|uniref:IclR family transcriptional regulator n=1 Tax=Bordetella genomosp. 11 TaxID=1416808 RepID=UPI0020CB837C|nr:IclR family transcriptional regulator [Bordetella genomosp. 11]
MSSKNTPTPPVGVLERGISILESFSDDALRLSLGDLAERTGLDKATLLRLLGVLVRARLVHRYDNGNYAMGPATLHMGMLYRQTFDLGARIQPVLQNVMQQTGETVALYVRSGDERICLYRENTSQELRHHLEVGTRIPLSAGGSSAHILLAFTGGATPHAKTIREKGYAMTRAERVAEMASVALPVFEADGSFIGAMVVLGLASRHNQQAQLKAADIVRRELGAQGFSASAPADRQLPADAPAKAPRR